MSIYCVLCIVYTDVEKRYGRYTRKGPLDSKLASFLLRDDDQRGSFREEIFFILYARGLSRSVLFAAA